MKIHSFALKLTTFIVAILTGLSTAVSGVALLYADDSNLFSSPAPYHESTWCYNITYDYAAKVMNRFHYSPDKYVSLLEHFSTEQTNFRFRIVDEDNNVLLSNFDEVTPSTPFVESYPFDFYDDIDEKNEVHKKYQILCYLQTPLTATDDYTFSFQLYDSVYTYRNLLLPVFIGSLLLMVLSAIYLFYTAGHRSNTDSIVPNIQDKIPLDLYLAGSMSILFLCAVLSYETQPDESLTGLILTLLLTALFGTVGLATLLTCTTRLKLGKWWRNTISWKVFGFFCRIVRQCVTAFRTAVVSIPMFWKVAVLWILVSSAYIFGGGIAILLNLALLALFCYIALQMQQLQTGGEELVRGNLSYKVDTQKMLPSFAHHGENLNSISDGLSIAVQEQMKSERMKTELITNVSHDIKTPLTSIINYVDLLKKEELTGQAAEYLEVLDRQSARLKKLTEDLVEASKASTGNLNCNLVPTDFAELLHQAVAEYEEKLNLAQLETVIHLPEAPVFALLDGNLSWRILNNLLSNVCKYAQPNTRLYLDVTQRADEVSLAVKNISRESLNIPAEELMERFVRGDASRSTEGSGLGLNIARSLTELQKGKFSLEIDEDLFKVQITFPKAKPSEGLCPTDSLRGE